MSTWIRAISATTLFLASVASPARAQAPDHSQETCRDLLTFSLPRSSEEIQNPELRLNAQLHLADYYRRSGKFGTESVDSALDLAAKSAIDVIDREQDRKTGETPYSARQALENFSSAAQRVGKGPQYLALLSDHLMSIDTLHELSPGALKVVQDLDLPIFKDSLYLSRASFRAATGANSLAYASSLAQQLKQTFDTLNKQQPGLSEANIQRLTDSGIGYNGLQALAAKLADTVMQVSPTTKPEDSPFDLYPLIGTTQNRGQVEFVEQLLTSYGLPEKAANLKTWISQRDAFEKQESAQGGAADADAWNKDGRMDRDLEREVRIVEINRGSAGDPKAAAAASLPIAAEVEFLDKGETFRSIENKLIQLHDVDALALGAVFVDRVKDPKTRYLVLRDLAAGYRALGHPQEALAMAQRQAAELPNLERQEGNLASHWREVLQTTAPIDPANAWGGTLPAAIRSINEAFKDKNLFKDAKGKPDPDVRDSAIQDLVGKDLTPASQFGGLFWALSSRDSNGRRQLDFDQAFGFASALEDPSLKFAAQMAVCSLVIERTQGPALLPVEDAEAAQTERALAAR